MIWILLVLALNLIWPRSRRWKFLALVALIAVAWLIAVVEMTALNRTVYEMDGRAPRVSADSAEQVRMLRSYNSAANTAVLQACLGLTFGILFAAVPPNILARAFPGLATRLPSPRSTGDKAAKPSSTD